MTLWEDIRYHMLWVTVVVLHAVVRVMLWFHRAVLLRFAEALTTPAGRLTTQANKMIARMQEIVDGARGRL